jgi:hypothetical protein
MKTKPFNLEEALRTNRAVTRDGREVIIAGHNAQAQDIYRVIGWLDDSCTWWREDGKIYYQESLIDLLLPADEPKLRPWKMEEVPLNAWFRLKECINLNFALRIDFDGVFLPEELVIAGMAKNPNVKLVAFLDLKENFEYTLDGKTFHPCGVLE